MADTLALPIGSKQSTSKSKKSSKHTPARFTEGWAEFADKRVGRVAAEMLNARPIGSAGGGSGKRGKRWKDDVWTMKYLPGFKWGMLSEQIGEFDQLLLPVEELLV